MTLPTSEAAASGRKLLTFGIALIALAVVFYVVFAGDDMAMANISPDTNEGLKNITALVGGITGLIVAITGLVKVIKSR